MYQKSAIYYDAIYSFKKYQNEAEKVHSLIQKTNDRKAELFSMWHVERADT